MGQDERVLGVDFGTEGVRVGLYDLTGTPDAFVTEPYETTHPAPGWAEQRPEDWWSSFSTATRRLLADTGIDPDRIIGLGFDTTSCSVVFARADGTPLRPSIIWMDIRSSPQTRRVASVDSIATRYQAGADANAEWLPWKALWVKEHQPEIYERTEVLCEFGDWIGFRLTGRWTAGLQQAVVRWYYQPRDGGWPEDLYRGIGLEDAIERFPREIVPAGHPVGELSAEAAEDLGLRPGTVVGQGGIDAYVALIGLDAMRPGQTGLITGSSHLQLIHTDELSYPPGLHGAFPDVVVPGLSVVEGGQISTGSIAAWFKRTLGAAGATASYADLDRLATEVAPGADGLVLLDYWQGNRTPHGDPRARGALWGMTLHHGLGHLWRALLEGVALGTAANLAIAEKEGASVEEIRICGGVCNSPLWMQIHADVTGVPLVTTAVPEAAGLGSGILAAHAAGAYGSVAEASEAMVTTSSVVEPRPEHGEAYAFLLDRYRGTYDALRDEMHEMSAYQQGSDETGDDDGR